MRFGLFTSMGGQTWSGVLDLWRHLEATRWDIACVTDHFMPNTKEREGTMLESWSTLAGLAALVPRLRVGTIVLGDTYRHPAVVAKMAAQVDIISGGRLGLGLGAGWQRNEHEAYGIPFSTLRERLERLDEACEVIRSLWTERRATFKGRYYQLSDAPLDPKPIQTPHPELRDTEREDPRRALRRSRSRPEDHQALGQHGVAHHRQEGRDRAARRHHRQAHGPPRRRRPRHLPGRYAGSDSRPARSAPDRPGGHGLRSEHVPSPGRTASRSRPVQHRDRASVPVGECPDRSPDRRRPCSAPWRRTRSASRCRTSIS